MEEPSAQRPEDRVASRRQRTAARRLQVLLAISLGVSVLFVLRHAPVGRWRATAIGVALGLAIWGVRRWAARDVARTTAAAHAMNAIGSAGVTSVALLTGQSTSIAVPYLAVAPLFAAYQLGTRAAVLWGVVSAGLVAIVHASELVIAIDPEFLFTGVERIPATVVFVGLVVALGLAARRSSDTHIERIESRERLLSLQAAEIARARDEALAADKAKSEFLANVSHEIRTPLNGILGTTEVLLDRSLPDSQRTLLETIRGSGLALMSMLNDVLDLSRLEAGRMPIDARPFDPRTIAHAVRDLFARDAQRKSLTLDATVADDVPSWVLGDDVRVRQVLLNLTSNAVKFTHDGGVTIRIERAGDSDELSFVVRDTGPGIAPADHERLFQSFTQLDGSSTRRHGGSGLGLTISKSLVERMGGSIEIVSDVGRGAAFRVVLPLPACEAPPERPSQRPGARAFDTGLAETRPLRILVAEDNPTNRDVFALMLERFGYAPTMVEDGELAVECAAREDFDLILMDLHMPNLDGVEATRRILASRADRPRPRIVALTADVRPEQRKACLDAGMTDFLGKPIRIGELERVLRESRAIREAPRPPADSDEAALGRLRTLCANRPGAFERLVAQHVTESRTLVDAMHASAGRGDAEALRAAAHRLKSSSALFGEMDVSRFAEQIERLDVAAHPDAVERLLAQLETATQRAASRLDLSESKTA